MKKTIIGLVIKILIGSVLPAVPVAAAIATVSSVIFTEEAVAADTTCSYFLGSLRCTGGLSTVTCSDFLGSFRCTGAYSFTCSEFLGSYRCSGGLAASFTCSEFLGSYRCSGGLADFSCSEFLGSIRCSGIDGSFSCSEFLGSFRCSGTTSPLIPVIAKKFGNLTSSGGTSGGTSSGSTTKSCTKAPEIPSLTSSTTSDGIQFSALAKLTGEKATSLFYSYSYFDGIKNAWDAWSSWYTASPSTGVTYKALSGNSKTFVAFAVYASNSCGDSEQARETPSRTGLKLPTQTDTSATGLGNTGRFVSINANLNKIELSSTGSSSSVITVNVTDIVGKPVPNVSFVLQIVGVGAFINLQKSLTDKTNSKGEYLAEVKSSEAGTSTVKVTVTSPGQFNDSFGIVNGVARSGAKAGISSSSLTINFERTSSSLTSLDAAQEAADAANAATDAANAAAEGTAAATTAAQNAADAVAALSSQVSELVASLKKQILSLSALIAKIQTKLNS